MFLDKEEERGLCLRLHKESDEENNQIIDKRANGKGKKKKELIEKTRESLITGKKFFVFLMEAIAKR